MWAAALSPASHSLLAAAADAGERARAPTPQALADDERDREWLTAVAHDDLTAFTALMDAYAHRLARFAESFTYTRESADEVVQDVFVWIWDHRTALHIEGSVAAYLYKAVRNRALNAVRREHAQERLMASVARDAELHTSTIANNLGMDDVRAEAAFILRLVPARCREIFLLVWGHEMTYQEVSNVLGVGIRTVQNQYYRAVAALAKHFETSVREKSL